MKNKKVVTMVQAAMVAAVYVVLTYVSAMLGLASGSIQIRLSEMLCILPVFMVGAIPGLWIGCFLANLLTGCMLIDVVCGSIATLLGAVGTYLLRKHRRLCTWPPVIANMIIVPLVLRYGYGLIIEYRGMDWSLLVNAITVGIGEIISCVILGSILLKVLAKYRNVLFQQ